MNKAHGWRTDSRAENFLVSLSLTIVFPGPLPQLRAISAMLLYKNSMFPAVTGLLYCLIVVSCDVEANTEYKGVSVVDW